MDNQQQAIFLASSPYILITCIVRETEITQPEELDGQQLRPASLLQADDTEDSVPLAVVVKQDFAHHAQKQRTSFCSIFDAA